MVYKSDFQIIMENVKGAGLQNRSFDFQHALRPIYTMRFCRMHPPLRHAYDMKKVAGF